MAIHYLSAPLAEEDVTKLRVGDSIYISGKAFTCRSRLHRWVLDEGNPFPFDHGETNVLIHTGPIVLEEHGCYKLVSFMPTSSIRFEKWGARTVREWGLRMIIGKTTMGDDTMRAMVERKCVHVSPNSVSPNLWCSSIRIERVDLFKELGTIEATWHLSLDKLGPFVVDIDCQGNNLYAAREQEIDRNRRAALEKLGITEDFKYTKLY
jgi:tartrate/fumarate subfamily iron-sulfur-dependent hydro-lyase beta chain